MFWNFFLYLLLFQSVFYNCDRHLLILDSSPDDILQLSRSFHGEVFGLRFVQISGSVRI